MSLRALIDEFGVHGVARPVHISVLAPDNPSLRRAIAEPPDGVTVQRVADDFFDLARVPAVLAAVDPTTVVIGSTVAAGGPRTADARARLAGLHVQRAAGPDGPPVILSTFFPVDDRVALDRAAPVTIRHALVISTVRLLSRSLVLGVRAPHWGEAAEELLGSGSARLDIVEYEPADGRATTFASVYGALLDQGAVPMGISCDGEAPVINPEPGHPVSPGDAVLIVRRVDAPAGGPPPASPAARGPRA
jgi:hypothetical protein